MWTSHLRWRRSVSLLALLSLPCVRHPDKSNPLLNKQLGLRYSGIVEDKAGLSSLDRIHCLTRCKSSGFIEFSTKNNSLLRCIGTWANFIYTSAHRFFPFFKTLFPLWRLIRNIKEHSGTDGHFHGLLVKLICTLYQLAFLISQFYFLVQVPC